MPALIAQARMTRSPEPAYCRSPLLLHLAPPSSFALRQIGAGTGRRSLRCANMCSCQARARSCTPTSTRSTRRSSSATTRACADGRSSSAAGVVLAASYEAKAFGVRTAMGGRQARRLCPHAVVVRRGCPPTSEASKAVFEVFEDTAPLVEGLSIDEAFLDVRGMERIAGHARSRSPRGCKAAVRERVGLPITVGVARTKFLAKVASARCEAGRAARRPARRRARVPAPAARRAPVGRRGGDRREARARGIETVGQVALAGGGPSSCACSAARPGATSTRSRTTAIRGRVAVGRRRRLDRRPARLGRGAARRDELDTVLVGLVDRVTRRMRTAGRVGPHGGPAPALRRLHPRHPVAHAALCDRPHARRCWRPRVGSSPRRCR